MKERGICVHANTLGALEALLFLLNREDIPVRHVNLGPISRKDLLIATLEQKDSKYALLVAFDVSKKAQELLHSHPIRVLEGSVVFSLVDQVIAYVRECEQLQKKKLESQAIFPAVLEILPKCIFHKSNPILLGVKVLEGILKVKTPLCRVDDKTKEVVSLGCVENIQINNECFRCEGQSTSMYQN